MLDWRDTPTPGTALRWTPCGPEIVGTSPLRVQCPAESCKAAIGQPCTRLAPRRGHIRRAPHDARKTAATTHADQSTSPQLISA